MLLRTDMATELMREHEGETMCGVRQYEDSVGGIKISRICVQTAQAAELLGKPLGEYVTVEVPPFSDDVTEAEDEIKAMAGELRRLIDDENGLVLVVGLGNRQITPDAFGPCVADDIIATRHIKSEVSRAAGLHKLRPVAVLAPGVLGQTGVETSEVIAALAAKIKPCCVIAADALASRSLERLGCTVQFSNSGISPGSGVANARSELSKATLGFPVISVGVPTVVDAVTLAGSIVRGKDELCDEELRALFMPRGEAMMVTPREIDLIIKRASRVVSLAINMALQPHMALRDIIYLTT